MGMDVRADCVNQYNPLWKSCLDSSGFPPSGREWQWVADRVLVMMWRQKIKNQDPLPANQGDLIIVYARARVCLCLIVFQELHIRVW